MSGDSTQTETNLKNTIPKAEDILLMPISGSSLDQHNAKAILLCSIYENQRPIKGVAGQLDWLLRGFLSRFVISGQITGTMGEITYVPIPLKEANIEGPRPIRHLLLVGLGPQQELSAEKEKELLKKISNTITKLGFSKVFISKSSFPFFSEQVLKKLSKDFQWEFAQ